MVLRTVIEVNKEKPLFQLFFLKDDAYHSVEVEEVEEIDFRIVKKRLGQGESIFITRKCKQNENEDDLRKEELSKLLQKERCGDV